MHAHAVGEVHSHGGDLVSQVCETMGSRCHRSTIRADWALCRSETFAWNHKYALGEAWVFKSGPRGKPQLCRQGKRTCKPTESVLLILESGVVTMDVLK